jgi:hypothetical protein
LADRQSWRRRHTREGGYLVRCGLSDQSLSSLEYWITRLREGFAKVEQIGKGSPLVMSIR